MSYHFYERLRTADFSDDRANGGNIIISSIDLTIYGLPCADGREHHRGYINVLNSLKKFYIRTDK